MKIILTSFRHATPQISLLRLLHLSSMNSNLNPSSKTWLKMKTKRKNLMILMPLTLDQICENNLLLFEIKLRKQHTVVSKS